jgi:hypothetical protein
VAGGAVSVGLFFGVFEKQRSPRPAAQNGSMPDIHQMDANAVQNELRVALPLGSKLASVEDYLQKRRVEFSFVNSSRIVYADVRGVKGSSFLVREDVLLEFHFDESLKLSSVDARVRYTGP